MSRDLHGVVSEHNPLHATMLTERTEHIDRRPSCIIGSFRTYQQFYNNNLFAVISHFLNLRIGAKKYPG